MLLWIQAAIVKSDSSSCLSSLFFPLGKYTPFLQVFEILKITPRNHYSHFELPRTYIRTHETPKLWSSSQTCASKSAGGLVRTQTQSPTAGLDSVDLGWDPRTGTFDRCPGDAEDAGLGVTLWAPLLQLLSQNTGTLILPLGPHQKYQGSPPSLGVLSLQAWGQATVRRGDLCFRLSSALLSELPLTPGPHPVLVPLLTCLQCPVIYFLFFWDADGRCEVRAQSKAAGGLFSPVGLFLSSKKANVCTHSWPKLAGATGTRNGGAG